MTNKESKLRPVSFILIKLYISRNIRTIIIPFIPLRFVRPQGMMATMMSTSLRSPRLLPILFISLLVCFGIAGCSTATPEGLKCSQDSDCTSLASDCGEAFCVSDLCEVRPSAAETECRKSVGSCDLPEYCDGTTVECPVDRTKSTTVECRVSASPCDAAEFCDGTNGVCPADQIAAMGTICRPAAAPCDADDVCDGVSASCPEEDTKAGEETVCRESIGPCDQEETCTGDSDECPADILKAQGVECRSAATPCDAPEVCDGLFATCLPDSLATSGTVCRPAVDACDAPEVCDGITNTCPEDLIAAAGVECRPIGGSCDVVEVCDGLSNTCPEDTFLADGEISISFADDICHGYLCNGNSALCPTSCVDNTDCEEAYLCDEEMECTANVSELDLTPQTGSLVENAAPLWADKGYVFTATVDFQMVSGKWYINMPMDGYIRISVYSWPGLGTLGQGTITYGNGIEEWLTSDLIFDFQAGQQYLVTFYTNRASSSQFDRMNGPTYGYEVAGIVENVISWSSYNSGDDAPEGTDADGYLNNSWAPLQILNIR